MGTRLGHVAVDETVMRPYNERLWLYCRQFRHEPLAAYQARSDEKSNDYQNDSR